MREIKSLTNNKFLNIKEVCDSDMHVKGYQFAERRGVDSVAFICWDSNTNEFLLNHEYKPPVNEFIYSAFGGSLDKGVYIGLEANEKSAYLTNIVIGEAREEAGFKVTEEDIYFVGRAFVSTQMNQFCWLYLVKVDREKQLETKPENAVEGMATPTWMGFGVEKLDDWKAITIIAKARAMGIMEK
jgi:hypothetical protein